MMVDLSPRRRRNREPGPPAHGPETAIVLLALALSACRSASTSCTVEVTEGAGIYRGTIAGARPRANLERDALRGACNQLCAAQGTDAGDAPPSGGQRAPTAACVARCTVDAEAGKIGLRKLCKEGSAR